MANGKPETQGERITAVETEVRNLKEQNKEEHSVINDKLGTIIVALAPIEELTRKVNDHHVDLKEVKPTVRANKRYIGRLENAGCPAVKVTPEDIKEAAEKKRANLYKTIGVVLALLTLIVTNLIALLK